MPAPPKKRPWRGGFPWFSLLAPALSAGAPGRAALVLLITAGAAGRAALVLLITAGAPGLAALVLLIAAGAPGLAAPPPVATTPIPAAAKLPAPSGPGAASAPATPSMTAPLPAPPARSGRSEREAMVGALADETNRIRADKGLKGVILSDDLCVAAQAHAEDMLQRGYFDHRSPEGNEPADRIVRWAPLAIVLGARENIMRSDGEVSSNIAIRAGRAVEGWLVSKGHRENLLAIEATHVGFGVATGAQDGRRVELVVQVLGIVAGRWERIPDAVVHPPAQWFARLARPLEFFLEDSSRPDRPYPDPKLGDRVWRGGVPLLVEAENGRTRVWIPPRLESGPYKLLARLAGEESYQVIRPLVVRR